MQARELNGVAGVLGRFDTAKLRWIVSLPTGESRALRGAMITPEYVLLPGTIRARLEACSIDPDGGSSRLRPGRNCILKEGKPDEMPS